MKSNPASAVPPEIELADRYLRSFPRVDRVTAGDLFDYINQHYPALRSLNFDYHSAALEVLVDERYVMEYSGDALSRGEPRYGLTQAGRDLKAEGSFSQTYLENKQDKVFTKKVAREEGHKKIWDNRSKYVVFAFAALGAAVVILGFWASHMAAPGTDKSIAQGLPTVTDSSARVTQPKKDPASLIARKHHPKTEASVTAPVPVASGDGAASVPPPRPAEPLQSTVTDDTEFKLLRAQGNTRTQSITMIVVLTTSRANWIISSGVRSIIDNDGNEYNLKSYTLGAQTIITNVELVTGVPIRCTYTFGGVLPNVKKIKLFNYVYYHSGGQFSVEFRDIPIDWR
jgi:hypothetical protein